MSFDKFQIMFRFILCTQLFLYFVCSNNKFKIQNQTYVGEFTYVKVKGDMSNILFAEGDRALQNEMEVQ